jgi:lysophospholipase L1-like esterase
MANGLLLALVTASVFRLQRLSLAPPATASAMQPNTREESPSARFGLGQHYQLTYEQWVGLLGQEARVVAEKRPAHLAILMGDSLSLWFPTNLLLPGRTWLNQGISGETSTGLLKRLNLIDQTQPEIIFVMIGINDLIRGVDSETILDHQQSIIRYLKTTHPDAQIVIQSILPHAMEQATWERRDRLLAIPNSQIRELNQKLAVIAATEDVQFLNLYPLFADSQGDLRIDLSTDGLHLNQQGYLVWRTAIAFFMDMKRSPQ